jgi:hypothetical protein
MSNEKAVRWYKNNPDETAVVQVFENGRWVGAQQSTIFKPDVDFKGHFGSASKGFATFQNALRLGYVNKGLYVSGVKKHD